jgi:phosphohistidine phosphatase
MFIYIARHAWAHQRNAARWPDDSIRELTTPGIARYQQMIRPLVQRGFTPERIATSPYVRCRQTAEILAAQLPEEVPIDELPALQPGSNLDALLGWTAEADGKSVCWVGHAPDVSLLTAALIGSEETFIRFAKGAVAAIRSDSPADSPVGELQWLVTAKILGIP